MNVNVEPLTMLTISYLTYTLIAALNVSVGGALFGWVYEGHKANCEHRSRVFIQRQLEQKDFQGPVNECIR